MPYQDNHLNDLNEVINLFKDNKIYGADEALQKFTLYLETVQSIGSFTLPHWRVDWRKKVWELGVQFKTRNPQEFFQLIDKKLLLPATTNKEVLEFIRSEMAFNFLPDNECKKQLQALITKYPLNPEFRHTLGHYYTVEKDLLASIEEYKLACKIDPTNSVFRDSRFLIDQSYLDSFITDGEYQKGKVYLNSVLTDTVYINSGSNIHPTFVDFHRRFDDHIIFQNKLKQIEADFKTNIHSELENERKRIIEVLGFFSAVVAFILSTVSIGKHFSFIEATYFIIALGIILILFVVALSTLFSTAKTELFKDRKFWILIVGLTLLFLFIVLTNSIANLLQHISN